MSHRICCSLLATLAASAPTLASQDPIAAWDFDEGRGAVVHDRIGSVQSAIHGAAWTPVGKGFALHFDGVDDYVDCGADPRLNLTGQVTLEAWVHPDRMSKGEPGILGKFFESYALTYYQGSCYFYLSSGGNNVSGALPVGRWSHVVGVFDGEDLRFYQNGREISSRPSAIREVKPGRHFTIGCIIGDPANKDIELRNTAFFAGKVDSVRVYDRAISPREIILHYNLEAAEKGLRPIDLERLERLTLQEFVYPEDKRLVLRADYGALKPLPDKARIVVRLSGPGLPVEGRLLELEPSSARGIVEASFSTGGLGEGEFEIRASVVDAGGQSRFESVRKLRLPTPEPSISPPAANPLAPLAPRLQPPAFRISVERQGGLKIDVKGVTFPIESSFSFPGGGVNELLREDKPPEKSEPDWTVRSERLSTGDYRVDAEGVFYRIERRVRPTPTRVLIEDTFVNKTDDVLGILISNHVDARKLRGAVPAAQPNCTVFVPAGEVGVGLLAMDDLYHVHCESTNADGIAALRDSHFGLDKGASYTLKWAVYPTGSGTYLDFINQVRKDEGLNGSVRGALALSGSWELLPESEIRNKGLAYYGAASLTRVMSNPTISLEGWEFMKYPDIRRRLKEWISLHRRTYPDMKIMFHVAHSLYLTDKPRELFGDSIAVDENGQADHYGPNTIEYYGNYISKELFDQGWRWWLFYPTMENSFGRLMLEATDVMIHELGANAIWADGFIEGYIKSGYTYDRWDGHSVTIDPATGKVVRKKGNITYLALPVLKEVVRRFDAADGLVFTNGRSGPLSFVRMKSVISSNETGGGDQQPIAGLYLGRTVTPLGNQSFIQAPEDIWTDILTKLDLGALYFWYGERDFVTEPTMVSHMYPITLDAIEEGTIRGRERIITKKSGVYGWPGERSLHQVHPYDGRGRLRPNRHVTCVDAAGVRTQLDLGENEAAVIERLPIVTRTSAPVHLIVQRADDGGLRMRLNGTGDLNLVLARGGWKFTEETGTRAMLNGKAIDLRREESGVTCGITLNGEAVLKILPAGSSS